jgi:hypothetical protein
MGSLIGSGPGTIDLTVIERDLASIDADLTHGLGAIMYAIDSLRGAAGPGNPVDLTTINQQLTIIGNVASFMQNRATQQDVERAAVLVDFQTLLAQTAIGQ